MPTQNKFTATLVNEADKALVVQLRNETGLSEKQVMTLIINAAMQPKIRDEIVATAKNIVTNQAKEREEARKANYESLKQAMKEVRQKAKEQKAKKTETAPQEAAH